MGAIFMLLKMLPLRTFHLVPIGYMSFYFYYFIYIFLYEESPLRMICWLGLCTQSQTTACWTRLLFLWNNDCTETLPKKQKCQFIMEHNLLKPIIGNFHGITGRWLMTGEKKIFVSYDIRYILWWAMLYQKHDFIPWFC